MLIIFSMNVSSCQQLSDDEQQLRSEIGQMLIIGFGGFKQDDEGKVLWDDKDGTQFNKSSVIAQHIAKNHIGGVVLFQQPFRDIKTGAFVHDRNIQNPAQGAKLHRDLQSYNKQMGNKNSLFLSVDQEGGRIDRLPAPQGFPVRTLLPQAFGAKEEIATDKSKATKETYEYAKKLAQEVFDAGFNLNFAPVVDVNINPTCPIIGGLGRSFSSYPKVVVDQAEQFIRVFKERDIIPVLKHFPGHGSSSSDSHLGLVDVTGTYRMKLELQPYSHIIAEGYDGMIMTTHIINGQIDQTQCKAGSKTDHSTWCPGTMSKKTLTNLLREQMGFKGLIVSDDMTMGAIAQEYDISESFKNAINAGVDIFIVANNYEDQTDKIINAIAQLVKNGEIEREKIDAAYNRIVEFKKKHLIY